MTIFHVIKYPPKEIIFTWFTTDKAFFDLLPGPIADDLICSDAYRQMHRVNMAIVLEKLLQGYEGPL